MSINVNDKNLGHATAYAYYKAGGGTMTEAEFTEFMADFGTASQTAVEAAQAALASKNAAQTAATTATNKATEATTAATTATTKAGEASTSASTAASAKDTAVSASQTATSKASEATTAAATATSAKTDAVAANTAAQSAKTAAQTAQTGAETAAASVSASAEQIATNAEDISQLKSEITALAPKEDMLKAFPTDTASGNVASFADGANVPVKSLIVNIDPVQSGSGDPSPTNVRPISGWDAVQIERRGKNLLPITGTSRESSGITYTVNSDGTITANGTATADSGFVIWDKNTFGGKMITKELSCVLSGCPSGGGTSTYMITSNGFGGWGTSGSDSVNTILETYNQTNILILIKSGVTVNNLIFKPMIRLASDSDATFEPYNGQSINIQLGQTVYGGKLDVTNGVLTTYPYYASYNGETLTGAWISDRDKYVSGATPTTGAQVVNIGGAGTDVQLDLHEVTALLGSNNIWADSGDSEVTYRADPTLYIQRLTEPDADMVADANITSGSYFMVGNTLYKATANIASGATISPNVNCTRKSLSEALNELNA